MIFVMLKRRVFFGVEIKFLQIIHTSFGVKGSERS